MNEKEEVESTKLFDSYVKNVKPEDINKVLSKIGSMNKGALKEIWNKVVMLWEMIKDPSAEWGSKAIALGALVYTVSPIDAIPDMLPGIGLVDDAGVITAAITMLGNSLMKYTEDKKNLIEVNNNSEELKHKLEVIVSILHHASYADNELSLEEETKCSELIEHFIFSDEGFYDEETLLRLNISKKEIKKAVSSTFNSPLSIDDVAEITCEYDMEEDVYLYAYTITYADEDINSKEREFLDVLASKIGLDILNKNRIERNFNSDWIKTSQV